MTEDDYATEYGRVSAEDARKAMSEYPIPEDLESICHDLKIINPQSFQIKSLMRIAQLEAENAALYELLGTPDGRVAKLRSIIEENAALNQK